MVNEVTMGKLREMGFSAMAEALRLQMQDTAMNTLSFPTYWR